jgi:hypothetical protein
MYHTSLLHQLLLNEVNSLACTLIPILLPRYKLQHSHQPKACWSEAARDLSNYLQFTTMTVSCVWKIGVKAHVPQFGVRVFINPVFQSI